MKLCGISHMEFSLLKFNIKALETTRGIFF